ncbi:reverse transcriptase domain-containing protein [Tanacetum coccineum]
MANLMGQMQKALQERPHGALPSNTIPNPREEIKAITTRSGFVLDEPSVPLPSLSSSSKKVEQDPEMITDQVLPESTTRVPPLVVQPSPNSRYSELPSPVSSPSEPPKRNPHQPPISYPSRLNKEKLQDKYDIKVHKFFQMFKKLHFNISLAEALALMPKYHKMLKDLLSDKEKLLGLANTSLTENCSAVLLKKLPEKLGDPGKFLIPCDFPELEKCMALANLGASINLMPLSVWKKLMLSKLVPTRMTLELANRFIAYPAGIAEDVFVQVGKFTFPADFVVVDYNVDPRVPFILGRPFLRTARALVDVYGEELILRDGDEKLIFHAESTTRHPHKHGNELINMINCIDITCEDRFDEETDILLSYFNDSSPDYETFCFDIEEKSSGSTTSHSYHSLLEYESFCFDVDHIGEKSSGNTTSYSDLSLLEYESFHFDLSIDPLPPADRSDSHLEEFADELAHIISLPEYDRFYFDIEPDPGELTRLLKKNISETLTKDLKIHELNDFPLFLSDCDSIFSEKFSEIDLLVLFPSGNKEKVFDPGIFTINGVHSKRFSILLLDDFSSILFVRDFLFLTDPSEIDTFLSFPSGNEDKIFTGESKVHIEVLSVLWGNRLPIPGGSLPLSSLQKGRGNYRGRNKTTVSGRLASDVAVV